MVQHIGIVHFQRLLSPTGIHKPPNTEEREVTDPLNHHDLLIIIKVMYITNSIKHL